jgi:hypothetical protein
MTTERLLFFPNNFKDLYDLKLIKIPMEGNPVRRESATQFSPIHFPCRSRPSSSVSPPPPSSSSLYRRVSGGRQDGQIGGRRTGCRPAPGIYRKDYSVDTACAHVDQRESEKNIGRVDLVLFVLTDGFFTCL